MRMMIYPYYQQQKIVHCPMSVDFSNVKIAYKFGEITPNGGTEYVHITNNKQTYNKHIARLTNLFIIIIIIIKQQICNF